MCPQSLAASHWPNHDGLRDVVFLGQAAVALGAAVAAANSAVVLPRVWRCREHQAGRASMPIQRVPGTAQTAS